MTLLSLSRRDVMRSAGAAAVLLAGGCSSLFTTAPPRLFSLKAPAGTGVAASAGSPPWSLGVGLPQMSQALDTERVALKRGGFELDYFANAAWSDSLPGLLQGLLIDSFEASGRVAAVFRDTLILHSDFLLLTQVKDFEAQYPDSGNTPPDIRVDIVAQLARSADKVILATLDARASSTAAENRIDAIIPAFDQAAATVVSQITGWAIDLARRNVKPAVP